MFDPGGSVSRLHACPFLGAWRTLLCGEVMRFGVAGGDLECFVLAGRMTRELSCRTEGGPRNIIFRSKVQAIRTYCGRLRFLRSRIDLKRSCRRGRLEAIGCQG